MYHPYPVENASDIFFPKTNECRDILYNKNNRALRTLMAYINFAVFCLCWHALFTESSVYYVLPSFSLPNASAVRLKKAYVNSSPIFVHFQKHSFHEMHKLIEKKTVPRACPSARASSFSSSSHPSIYLFPIHLFKHISSPVI